MKIWRFWDSVVRFLLNMVKASSKPRSLVTKHCVLNSWMGTLEPSGKRSTSQFSYLMLTASRISSWEDKTVQRKVNQITDIPKNEKASTELHARSKEEK